YVGDELGWTIRLVLRREEVPECRLGAGAGARLGWTTWLGRRAAAEDADDVVLDPAAEIGVRPHLSSAAGADRQAL
ncbi:MAG TPA: type VI secretion system baseplate subunit TssG, partial [Gammaproteobacteria bacterium]|nr:type VI secretion system baseplate subunit TssG [Gammaproteobacteria bacterium]